MCWRKFIFSKNNVIPFHHKNVGSQVSKKPYTAKWKGVWCSLIFLFKRNRPDFRQNAIHDWWNHRVLPWKWLSIPKICQFWNNQENRSFIRILLFYRKFDGGDIIRQLKTIFQQSSFLENIKNYNYRESRRIFANRNTRMTGGQNIWEPFFCFCNIFRSNLSFLLVLLHEP